MAKKKLGFEEALEKIETIVDTLENETIPLEQSISLYKEGLTLAAFCKEKLSVAEGEIVSLQKKAENSFIETPFEVKEENEDVLEG